jgi:8-oxo-dGTP pyrophosphatase MutT (NUDIX family)
MRRDPDIHKAAGVLLREGKVLVVRTVGDAMFVLPGGKLEADETPLEAMVREVREEVDVAVVGEDECLGEFFAVAAGGSGKWLKMTVYLLAGWAGDPVPCGEISELAWVDSSTQGLAFGSIFAECVLPELVSRGLVH